MIHMKIQKMNKFGMMYFYTAGFLKKTKNKQTNWVVCRTEK
jgi:hypothetical protein